MATTDAAFDTSDSEPTNPGCRAPSDVEQLLALFDAILPVPATSVVLWTKTHPNAEYALRLWCSAHGLRLEHMLIHGKPALYALREDFSTMITVYGEEAS